MDEDELRVALSAIELRGRELLRRVLIRDQADRDAIASQLSATATSEATIGPTSSTS